MNKINVSMDPTIPTEQKICHFAEGLYSQMIDNLSNQSLIFCLLIDDDAILPEYPGLTTANLKNVLLGGKSTGKATVTNLFRLGSNMIPLFIVYRNLCFVATIHFWYILHEPETPTKNVFTFHRHFQ
jgi:hypothetical protein